jgi:hypothetical protein
MKYLLPRNSYVSSIWSLIFDTDETQICSVGLKRLFLQVCIVGAGPSGIHMALR